jgi:hypothetical protein
VYVDDIHAPVQYELRLFANAKESYYQMQRAIAFVMPELKPASGSELTSYLASKSGALMLHVLYPITNLYPTTNANNPMSFQDAVKGISSKLKDKLDRRANLQSSTASLTTGSSSSATPYWRPTFVSSTPVSNIFQQETGAHGW